MTAGVIDTVTVSPPVHTGIFDDNPFLNPYIDEAGRQGTTRHFRRGTQQSRADCRGALFATLFLLSTTRSSHGTSSKAACDLTMS